jgi:hypothetical protein
MQHAQQASLELVSDSKASTYHVPMMKMQKKKDKKE